MDGHLPGAGHFPQGTLCAFIGLMFLSAYYLRAWGKVQSGRRPNVASDTGVSLGGQRWPEVRYLQWGTFFSVVFLMLAGAADTENDWVMRLTGSLMGLCAAIGLGILGVGFVALVNLWKELSPQLKKARSGSLILAVPMAILWLGLGLGVMMLFGMLSDKIPKAWEFLLRAVLWVFITAALYKLWKGRSHAALMLRFILMVSFTAIIAASAAFIFLWIASETAPLMVILFTAMGILNVIFYARWVRARALKNLEETPLV
jgi:hypothetical protein